MILSNPFKKNKKESDHRVLDLANLYIGLYNKEHWCQRSIARDKNGNRLYDPFSDECWSYCILGYLHILKAKNETFTLINQMVKKYGYLDADRFNDFSDHATVLKLIKECSTSIGYEIDDKMVEKIRISV